MVAHANLDNFMTPSPPHLFFPTCKTWSIQDVLFMNFAAELI